METIWIVGKYIKETEDGAVWYVAGVFDKEKDAVEVCVDSSHFVGPIEKGILLPDINEIWPGCYYPILPTEEG